MKAYTHFCAHLSRTSLNADVEHILGQIYGHKDNYRRRKTGHISELTQPN